jgi:hypothetical protein
MVTSTAIGLNSRTTTDLSTDITSQLMKTVAHLFHYLFLVLVLMWTNDVGTSLFHVQHLRMGYDDECQSRKKLSTFG